jgi:hypothetical protein
VAEPVGDRGLAGAAAEAAALALGAARAQHLVQQREPLDVGDLPRPYREL